MDPGRRFSMQVRNTVRIDREPGAVWSYLADLEHVPEWNPAIASTRKVSAGPVGVGTVFEQERSAPSRSTETLRITAFEPPQRLRVRGRLGPFDADLVYRVQPSDGGTRLTNVAELEARGMMRALAPLAARRVRDAVAANLRDLKARLEAA
jgi:carbon monoxide dehydrogenase subunit G